jgi:signal transduction histidine kinase
VRFIAERESSRSVRLEVINVRDPAARYRKGMGVGKLIVGAIAEIHGGRLSEEQRGNECRISLLLPLIEGEREVTW